MNNTAYLILLEAFFILLTGISFIIAKKIYSKFKLPLLNPIITSVVIIIGFLTLFNIEYSTYCSNTRLLKFILDVSVVAFGYLLYENIEFLKKNTTTILLANIIGSSIGIGSVLIIAYLLNTKGIITMSMVSKSITTPLAIEISKNLGGITSLTAVIVVFSGILGAVVGHTIFQIFNIKSPFARGIALGTSAHGLGTARALEYGALEGALGGLSIGLMGLFTSLISFFLQ
ncbi:MAG: LrgB family protein [Bacteroidetes bacterium]|nr:LrgB family protein [Bacteroidota bacterium]